MIQEEMSKFLPACSAWDWSTNRATVHHDGKRRKLVITAVRELDIFPGWTADRRHVAVITGLRPLAAAVVSCWPWAGLTGQ